MAACEVRDFVRDNGAELIRREREHQRKADDQVAAPAGDDVARILCERGVEVVGEEDEVGARRGDTDADGFEKFEEFGRGIGGEVHALGDFETEAHPGDCCGDRRDEQPDTGEQQRPDDQAHCEHEERESEKDYWAERGEDLRSEAEAARVLAGFFGAALDEFKELFVGHRREGIRRLLVQGETILAEFENLQSAVEFIGEDSGITCEWVGIEENS